MIETIMFYLFATVLIGAAIGVILSRNPVYSAMFLVLAFVTSAFLWILLEAEFLALVLVLVYVGAVMVLFLFVIMMLDINVERTRAGLTRFAPIGIAIGLLVVAQIGYVIWARSGESSLMKAAPDMPTDLSNTEMLGSLLYTHYAYPFELAAVILLVAIVAAISLTMRKRPGLKVQDVSKQVQVRREDRIRIVEMPAEKKE